MTSPRYASLCPRSSKGQTAYLRWLRQNILRTVLCVLMTIGAVAAYAQNDVEDAPKKESAQAPNGNGKANDGTRKARRGGSGRQRRVAERKADGGEWQRYYSMVVDDEEMESGGAEDALDMLADLAANPMDVNRLSRDDLERLVFLTDRQREDIAEYVDRYGPVRTVGELAMVGSLDATLCRLLQCFLYAGEPVQKHALPPLDTIMKRSRNELTAMAAVPLYTRDGYLKGKEKGYLGPKYKHWARYRWSYGRQLEAGLTASQDAGEPFFTGRNRWGYDFYSFYVALRNVGKVKTAVAGRYRLRLGMGLVLNTDLSLGKTIALTSVGRTANTLRPHSSRSEASYLQGAAATVAVARGTELTAFFSHRLVDATLNGDSATVKTLLQTGYHRTRSEMDRRRNTRQTAGGASLSFRSGPWRAALTGMAVAFNRRLKPDTSVAWRRYAAVGRTFANASLTYSYTSPLLQVAGETAVGTTGGLAALHTIGVAPSARLDLTLVHRYYSYRYRSLLASSFSDGGSVNNEHGVLLAVAWRPLDALALSAYADYARSAWPRYLISLPSHTWDSQLAATLTLGSLALNARYRLRRRQRDNATHTALTPRTEQRLRLSATLDRTAWHLATRADLAVSATDSTSRGWMLTQSGGMTARWLTADAWLAYFHTDSYDSRLYAYERGLLYSFAFPMFYGEGLRYGLRLRADISRRAMVMARCTVTDYFDRSAIGSGLQRIARSSQTDLELQLRLKF